jgi:hypothetical protein
MALRRVAAVRQHVGIQAADTNEKAAEVPVLPPTYSIPGAHGRRQQDQAANERRCKILMAARASKCCARRAAKECERIGTPASMFRTWAASVKFAEDTNATSASITTHFA